MPRPCMCTHCRIWFFSRSSKRTLSRGWIKYKWLLFTSIHDTHIHWVFCAWKAQLLHKPKLALYSQKVCVARVVTCQYPSAPCQYFVNAKGAAWHLTQGLQCSNVLIWLLDRAHEFLITCLSVITGLLVVKTWATKTPLVLHLSKGFPNTCCDQGVGLTGRGTYSLKPSVFRSLLET